MARNQSSGSGHVIAKLSIGLLVLGVLFTLVFSLGYGAGLETGRNESPATETVTTVEPGDPDE